jgi:GT2 family glycosyltransferase
VTTPTISVVIVNWNSREDVLAGIRSLRNQTDPEMEVIVVDNGSSDGSEQAIRGEFPDVRVLQTGANLGFAEGCNRGIEVSRGEWVFLLNNDAVAEPTCVAELRRCARQSPDDVGMIQPLIVFAATPTHVNSTGVVVHRSAQAIDRHLAQPVEAAAGAGDPFCATAGAALYRRSMLEKVRLSTGYLGRDYFMYFEDVDLGWRCRLAGYRTVYVHGARVRHRFQGSSKRRGATFAATQCRVNRVATLIHNGSFRFIVQTLPNTLFEARLVLREDGKGPLLKLVRRLPSLLADRRRVSRLCTVGRRHLEREWCMTRMPPFPDMSVANPRE